MYPIICKFGAFTVYSYGLMLAVAFILSSGLASQEARRQNINPDIIFNFSFLSVICGILGARILYVLENIAYYSANPLEVFMFQHGGLSWYGGLLAGIACGAVYLRKKKQSAYRVLDVVAPFLALGQAVGRIGCLFNGCCYGKTAHYGIYSSLRGAILIPTQAYSALLLLMAFFILRSMQRRPHRLGDIFFAYLLLYSLKRFFIEFLRADNAIIFLGLTLFQIISIIIFSVGLCGLLGNRRP